MSGVVELARFPELHSIAVAGASDEQSVVLPVDCMGFVIFTPTASVNVYWAVEAGQVTDAAGRRRTVPSGQSGGATGLRLANNETLYIGASGAAVVELEVYVKY